MKFRCPACNATFTIDDEYAQDPTVSAKCPYCGHVESIHRLEADHGDRVHPPPTSSLDLGFLNDFSPPAPGREAASGPRSGRADSGPRSGRGPASAPRASERGPPGAGARHLPADSGPRSGLDLELDPFEDLAPGPGSAPFPDLDLGFGGAGGGSPSAPRSNPSARGRFDPPAGAGIPSSGLDFLGAAPDPNPGDDAGCQVCGEPLADEFDRVIGLCERHQRERGGADPAPRPAATWFARTPDGALAGPLPLEGLRDRIRGGVIPLASEFSSDGQRFASIASFKELAYLSTLGVAGTGGVRTSIARRAPRLELSRYVTPLLAAVAFGGILYLAWTLRADLVRIYHGLIASEPDRRPTRPNPLRRYLADWRRAHPDISGTAKEHLETAFRSHREDTWRGYERAEKAFQRAMLLDENDPEAIAGYLENLAAWRYAVSPPSEIEVAQLAMAYALELGPRLAGVRRAAGALALASGDLDGCRAGAEAALERAPSDASARLLLAQCYLEGNAQLAEREAQRAKSAEPSLRRADRVLALGMARSGRFAAAYQALAGRLADEPKNGAVLVDAATIDLDVGRWPEAEAKLRRASGVEGDQQRALVELGRLMLQQRRAGPAAEAYRRAAQASAPNGERGAELYAGWARAELDLRRPRRANRLADQALRLAPRHVGAALARAEGAMAVGSATTAAALVRRAKKERSEDPAALVLEAQIVNSLGEVESALALARAAVALAPKDARLHLFLAGLYIEAGLEPQAYTTLRKLVDIDPARTHSLRPRSLLSPSDSALRETVRRLERSARTPRNAAVAFAAVAVAYLHLGDQPASARALRRSLQADDANVLGLLYEGQAGLDGGDPARAERAAKRLLLVERGSAVGHLILARAAVALDDGALARESFRAALRSNPGLLAAEFELAALDLSEGTDAADEARAVLVRAFTVEPDLLDLRKLLLRHGGA